MNKGDYYPGLHSIGQKVWTVNEVAAFWQTTDLKLVSDRHSYYASHKRLKRIRAGIYVLNDSYNEIELAGKLYRDSYVSFETILAKEGVIRQQHEPVYVATYMSRKVTVDGNPIICRRVKTSIRENPLGITKVNGARLATKERAMLDTLYAFSQYPLDNLSRINWQLVRGLLPIYGNRRLEAEVGSICR